MLSRIPLWIVLNFYAFLLDTLCIAVGVLTLGCYIREFFFCFFLCGGVTCLIGYAAITLHLTYPTKRHLFVTLKRRNRKQLHLCSFKDFVDAPCHRLIVRTVLAHLNQHKAYRKVLTQYYVYPWKRGHFATHEVFFFRSREEYEAWRNE